MTIGQKLKKLRIKKGITQLEVAKHVGVNFQTIYKYEKDIVVPPTEMLLKLAKYFNVTTDFLLDTDDIQELDPRIKNLNMAAYSGVDLAKLAQMEPEKRRKIVKTLNTIIRDFYDDEEDK